MEKSEYEREKMKIRNALLCTLVIAGIVAVLGLLYLNTDSSAKNAVLEPERIKFLGGITGFNLESHYPAITSDVSYVNFGVENMGGYATEKVFVIIDTKTGRQNFGIYVSQKSMGVIWKNYSYVEFKVHKNIRTGKIYFDPVYVADEEIAEMILNKGMYWFYTARKYFKVDTLEGLKFKVKSEVEKARQELKQELSIK